MITLTAEIDVTMGKYGTLNTATSTISGNNVSASIQDVVKDRVYGNDLFILEVSALDNGGTFSSQKENYYIGSELANEDGEFTKPYEITLNGKNIRAFTLVFDTYNNQHPNFIEVDGKKYEDDDNIFTVSVEKSDSHKITIDNWNAPNYPLKILGISIEVGIKVGRSNLKSLSLNTTDRGDNRLPTFGIISNTCEIEFNDLNGEILDYIEQDLLVQGLACKVYLNDTTKGESQQLGVYYADSWNYDNDSRSVSVSLKDDLEEWQNINVEGISYDYRTPQAKNLKYFYDYLKDKTPLKYNMVGYDELDDTTKGILSNTYIAYPFLESDTLWGQWDKLCQVAQAHIKKEADGSTSFVYNGGN